MAGVYVNDSSLGNPYKYGEAFGQPLKNFNANINSQEDFIFCGAFDGPNRLIPVPCYKTDRVTIDGERVYYPAMSLSDAKAFKALKE